MKELQKISQIITSNYIPTSVKKKGNTYNLEWQNVGNYRFTVTESKFIYSIEKMNKIARLPKLVTRMEDLIHPQLLENCHAPVGFIFHITRCGSTAFARAMAQSPNLLIYDEPYPFYSGALQYFSANWTDKAITDPTRKTVIKNLILTMGKNRNHTRHYFVKFRSWNVVFMRELRTLFPDVPFLFMFRNPVEVLVSGQKRANEFEASRPTPKGAYITNHPLEETKNMTTLEFLTASIQRMLEIALSFQGNRITYLNYQDFKKENFASILKEAFNYETKPDELQLMLQQFDRYSKDQTNKVRFVSDSAEKQKMATADIQEATDKHLNGLTAELDKLSWRKKGIKEIGVKMGVKESSPLYRIKMNG